METPTHRIQTDHLSAIRITENLSNYIFYLTGMRLSRLPEPFSTRKFSSEYAHAPVQPKQSGTCLKTCGVAGLSGPDRHVSMLKIRSNPTGRISWNFRAT